MHHPSMEVGQPDRTGDLVRNQTDRDVQCLHLVPRERIPEWIVEKISEFILRQIVDVFVPQVLVEIFEILQLIFQERIRRRTVEEIIDFLVSHVQDQIAEVFNAFPQQWE